MTQQKIRIDRFNLGVYYLGMEISEKGKKALTLVHKNMLGVRNDGKTPAWQHPLDVMGVVFEMFKATKTPKETSSYEQVALLHDIIEDTEIKASDLAKMGFNDYIIRSVNYLTKHDDCRFGTPDLVEYFYDLQTSGDIVAQIVKCCDRIANLREAKGVFKPYRLARYQFETKMFLIPIAKIVEEYSHDWGAWLLEELILLSITDSEKKNKTEYQLKRYLNTKIKEQRP